MADQPEKTAAAPAAPEAQPATTPVAVPEPAVSEPQPEPKADKEDQPSVEAEPASTATTEPTVAPTEAPVTESAPVTTQEQPQQEEVKEEKEEEKKEEEEKPAQPEYLAKNPALSQFFDRLPSILSATSYNEMWGVSLKDSSDVPTVNVLIKFLRANEGNVKLAEEQLTKALQWRKEMNPIALADGHYSAEKFGGLGYVTKYPEANGKEVITTWNIYGSVKNVEATFGDSDEFIKWRVALMELAIKDLKLGEATVVIDYDGEDPYQMLQVHDYLNVSFLRLNPTIRAATKKTIEVFATAYPELLREKFFVNVPTIMGWMFAAMKVFLSKNTTRKFHPISNGANLAREFPSFKDQFPKPYGGNGPALQDGAWTVKLDQAEPAAPAEAETAETEAAAAAAAAVEAPAVPVVAVEAPEEETAPVEAEEPKEEAKEKAQEESKEEPAKAETAQEAPVATEVK